MSDAIAEIESLLRGLLKGEFSSLVLSYNDEHASNYVTAAQARDQFGMYQEDDYSRIDWVSEEERDKAMEQNSVWSLQWYPYTPVGFNCIGASSLVALVEYVRGLDGGD